MAEIIAEPIAEKVVESLFTLIGRHVGFVWNYRSNISDLTKQIENLRDGKVRMQQSVAEANIQGDEIFPDVEKWLSRAEEIIKETDKFIANEREANRGCFHLKLRYGQSKEAKRQTGDIVIEIQESDSLIKKGVAHRPPPPGIGIGFSSISGYEVFKSREATLDQVMEALTDDGIRMVGVWGMGGVGKTTLVQQLAMRAQAAKQANEENLFDTVVMALNISQTPNVTKIQGEIASILGLKLERDESARAVQISQSLKKHKRILVILDDIWEPVAFEKIGIPYESDEHRTGYCKVLLTSREHDVLYKEMGSRKNFYVEHLCEEEAWRLFTKTVGDSVEKPEVQPIATEVVKKCEGLPVAIVTIAKALKGESVGVWRNALEELRSSTSTNIRGVSKTVYSCLELSYNYLSHKYSNDDAKSLFLLCGLMGDGDISMDDLLKYVMGLDLFGYMNSLEKARDKIVSVVNILKASSLLLDVVEDGHTYRPPPSSYFLEEEESNGYLRMHDVIRDVARSIASKDPHRFVVNEDFSLQEWEKRGFELRNYARMSLKCKRVQELPGGLVCPKLEFFLLDSNEGYLKIPDTFFAEMKEVRVLSLYRVDLTRLPSSLKFLSNLRTFCLHGYGYRSGLKDIAMVGELKKLQILSLVNCEIGELPEAMKQLSDLRMLSLRHCPAFIPRNVISSLTRLEHLCLRNIFHRWEGVEGGGRNDWFYELKHLSCLRALEVEIPAGSYLLAEDVSFENLNLTRYDIFLGIEMESDDPRRNTSRGLRLDMVEVRHLVKWFSKPLKIVEVLDLRNLDYIKHFVHELDSHGFLHLKYLSVFSSTTMQFIMSTLEMEMERVNPPTTAFPLLEELKLRELHKLEAVCHGRIPVGCFANLRVLSIRKCDSLKRVLWLPTTQGRESILEFPQLKQLELDDLPNLLNFYSTRISGSQEPPLIIPFFNHQVALPRLELLSLRSMGNVRTMWHNQYPVGSSCKLKKLKLWGCENLQTVFPSCFLEGLQSLQILEIRSCPSLKEIFEMDSTIVPPLIELYLHSQNPQGYVAFQNLNSLKVSDCTSLKYIFLTSMVNSLVQLEVLEISNCQVEEIVANDQNGLQEAVPLILLFPRLTSLKISYLCNLKRFYQDMYTLGCPLLTKLEVYNCDNVELLFQEKSTLQGEVDKQPLFLVDKDTFPNLEELKLSSQGSMEIWRGQFSWESFGKLRNLEIKECHGISVVVPCSKLQEGNNIERLTLTSCNSVKEVIQMEGLTVGQTFPRLTEMHLQDLPLLTHIFGFGFGFGFKLRPVLQNLHSLHVSKCGNLINIVSPSLAERLVQLKKLSVTNCSMVKEIVGDDNASTEEEDDIICSNTFGFPSLEEMEVKELPRFTHLFKKIRTGLGQNLQKLRSLEIHGCGNLEILLTLSMAKTLKQLESLEVKECDRLKEIVENEGGDDEVIFTELQTVRLRNLPNLKSFCSATYTFRFPCLTDIWVNKCPEMEFFCKGDLITPSLKKVWARFPRENGLKENDLNAIIHNMFIVTHPKEKDSQEKVPDEEDAEEGVCGKQHPNKVEDSVEDNQGRGF